MDDIVYDTVNEMESNDVHDAAAIDTPTVDKLFTFGTTGQNLVFSKPVEIRVALPGSADDTEVLLSVKHV